MNHAIPVDLNDENIKQLRHLKEVLKKHSYKTETLKGIDYFHFRVAVNTV
jgi:hypothetical protein